MELELKEEEREMEELDRYSNSFSSNFVGFFSNDKILALA